MVPKRISNMTERIGNLIRVHENGQIDDGAYTRLLRSLQAEFLSEPLNPEPLNPEPQSHGT